MITEITLWLILYLAGILPVTKCFMLHSTDTFYKPSFDDHVLYGLFWPLCIPTVLLVALIGYALTLLAKLSYLIEDK